MNLGDGLKLETQILDGKPKFILAPCAKDSKSLKQTTSKKGAQVHPLTIKPSGQILKATQNRQILKATQNGPMLKATQNPSVKTEKPFPKKRTGSGLSETKSEKNIGTSVSKKPSPDSLKQLADKGQDLIIQPDHHIGNEKTQRANIPVKKTPQSTLLTKHKTHKKPNISAEELRESLVCLTQAQFQQILKTINQATRASEQAQDGTEKATVQESSDVNAVNKSTEESIAGLLRKASTDLPAQDERTLPSENPDPTIGIKNTWQDGDLFGTLGERERDKSLLEAKKSQWRKELDEQVALKKKEKESSQNQTKYGVWANSNPKNISSVKVHAAVQPKVAFSAVNHAEADIAFKERMGTKDIDAAFPISIGPSIKPSSFSSPDLPAAIRTAFVMGEAAPLDHPFSAQKREQQKKWIEELNKQREEDSIRKMQEKKKFSEVEEHDRWAVHFDSLKKTNAQPLPVNPPLPQQFANPPMIPEPQEPIDLIHSERGSVLRNSADLQNPKSGFLRSMTSLLDPVQIEERDRKRQKQLEHQKAIAAQVEEKRRRKQMEEELRKREEQEEEQRLALERQMIQKQFEEDVLKQKKKEEVYTLKTEEMSQTMQCAKEEAQKLKLEQRIRELAQKGHNISNLQMNLAGNSRHQSRAGSSLLDLNSGVCSSESNDKINQGPEITISPRIDTAVQTDDFKLGINSHSEAYVEKIVHRDNSPEISIEFNEHANVKKQKTDAKHPAKKNLSSKENTNFSNDHVPRRESEVTLGPKHLEKPEWNTNKTGTRYIPASERYPKGHQKQRDENKARRRMELLHLVERNASRNLYHKNAVSPQISPSPQEAKKENNPVSKADHNPKRDPNAKRSESPPVPAVKNKLHQLQQRPVHGSTTPALHKHGGKDGNIHTGWKQSELSAGNSESDCERPPSSNFIPYVRTKEIYYLDPEAPMSRPSTHNPQYRQVNGGDHEPRQIFSSDHMRDPLLNPNLVKNKHRQQAILRGLSELRQGLLQKQKELETCLMPDIN